jgi:hypothetical protein
MSAKIIIDILARFCVYDERRFNGHEIHIKRSTVNRTTIHVGKIRKNSVKTPTKRHKILELRKKSSNISKRLNMGKVKLICRLIVSTNDKTDK